MVYTFLTLLLIGFAFIITGLLPYLTNYPFGIEGNGESIALWDRYVLLAYEQTNMFLILGGFMIILGLLTMIAKNRKDHSWD